MTEQSAMTTVQVSASPAQVWQALTEPEQIRAFMFGADVDTTWQPGSPIAWRGEYEGRAFADTGTVLEVDPGIRLVVTHYSPLSGRPDTEENHHRLVWSLRDDGESTQVTLEQTLLEGEDAEEAQQNWATVLGQLKEHVERG
ncbi:SRPBCC domain-containing protein [Nocardioides ginsengisoli]|uniref:SRPBCC domain-containing protein n=1 Tax=Nocardioides ginsengisoli TaxID=363868 RepID=A0ABW3VY38_9ACTN